VSPLLILTIVQALVKRAPAANRMARRSIVRPLWESLVGFIGRPAAGHYRYSA
jgi:hypothetical protein